MKSLDTWISILATDHCQKQHNTDTNNDTEDICIVKYTLTKSFYQVCNVELVIILLHIYKK